jgi:hypothetical protein
MIVATDRGGSAAGSAAAQSRTCRHFVPCPAATAPDRLAARMVASHPEQGWSLLCNGVVVFDDDGELLPDGSVVTHHRMDHA